MTIPALPVRYLSRDELDELVNDLATRPDGAMHTGALRGAQSTYPFNRAYIYR